MAKKTDSGAEAIPSADELRMKLLEAQMKEMQKQDKGRLAAEKKLTEFSDAFMKNHVSEDERNMIRRLVKTAAQRGLMEAMVFSFPSKLCTDNGRAINNSEAHWPDTLQGKAKELYEGFRERIQPQGYKLKAMIIDYPDGMPGDVGLFLNWSPPAK